MKRFQLLALPLLICLIAFSCKKDTPASVAVDETDSPKEITDPAKLFLKDVKSDPASEFYISGEFDGYKIYCASTHADRFPYHDTVFNAIYLNTSIDLDNIHLIRQNDESSVHLALYFDKAKIYTRLFPYVVPRPILDPCESVEVELINMKKLGTTGQGSPNDDFSFWSTTNQGVKVEVSGFSNNIMEGTFEGTLKTQTGSKMVVKNGKFRIKTIRSI